MEERSVNLIVEKKRSSKKTLAKTLSFSGKEPLVAVILDKMPSKKDFTKMMGLLEGIDKINIQMIILADPDVEFPAFKKIKVMPYSRKNRNVLLEAADIAIGFDFNDIEEMLFHGVVPISYERPEVKDYNPNHETGNSFVYRQRDPWAMFAALVRALETFRFPYDWKHIIREGLKSVEK